MRKLKVVYVGGVPAFSQGDDVVNSWTEGVGVFQTKVHRLPADSTHGLRRIDPLLILFKLTAMWSVFVKSLPCCHYSHQHKRAAARSSVCPYKLNCAERLPVSGVAPNQTAADMMPRLFTPAEVTSSVLVNF